MEIFDILERIDLFKGVSLTSRKALASVCISRHIKKNEMLFHEGDSGDNLFILVTGSVRIFKSGGGDRETVIKLIKPGEIFAEAVLFELATYPASALSLKTGLVYKITKRQFHDLLDKADFRNDFILTLMQKQRYLADRLHAAAAFDVEERLIRFLVDHYGKREEYRFDISKKDIASAIGTIPETLSRVLARMERDGTLTVTGKTIRFKKQIPFQSMQ